jgi:hypothetical protein
MRLFLLALVAACFDSLAGGAAAQPPTGPEDGTRNPGMACLWNKLTPRDRGRSVGPAGYYPGQEDERQRYSLPVYPERLATALSREALTDCGLSSDAESYAAALAAMAYWTHEEVSLAVLESMGARREDVFEGLADVDPEFMERLIAAADPAGPDYRLLEAGVLRRISRRPAFPFERQRRVVMIAVLSRLAYLSMEARVRAAPTRQ